MVGEVAFHYGTLREPASVGLKRDASDRLGDEGEGASLLQCGRAGLYANRIRACVGLHSAEYGESSATYFHTGHGCCLQFTITEKVCENYSNVGGWVR